MILKFFVNIININVVIRHVFHEQWKKRHFFATWRRKCIYGGKVHRRKRKGNPLFAGECCCRLYSLHSVR